MNTDEWKRACPELKAGTKVVATSTSLAKAGEGTVGTVIGRDPAYEGFYLIKWDGHKNASSVPWDGFSAT